MFKALDIVFSAWINFYQNLISDPNSSTLIIKNIGSFSIPDALTKIINEEKIYKSNKRKYLDFLLTEKYKHVLFSIDGIKTNEFIDKNLIKTIIKKNTRFFNKLSKLTTLFNIKNNRINLKFILISIFMFLKTFNPSHLRYIYNVYASLFNVSIMKKQILSDKVWQELPSAKSIIDKTITTVGNFDFTKKNFLFLHLLDPHERVSFFTYDSNDEGIINNEFESYSEHLNNLRSNFKGSLIYQLSLLYIDNQIKRLFDYLRDNKLEDSFTVLIMSDHGSSYTYYPIRKNVVNNFFKENYKVPLVIWDTKITSIQKINPTAYIRPISIFPTIFDLNGLQYDQRFKVNSLINDTVINYEFITTEYMGPGCADMISKNLWMSIRNNKYMISIENKVNENFNPKIIEIYDVLNDVKSSSRRIVTSGN
jgi:hypothetical protein